MASFPNYPFSLVLNTTQNPYITSADQGSFFNSVLMENTQAENLYQLNLQAIERVRGIANEQREIFRLLDEEIRKHGSKKGLQEILQNYSKADNSKFDIQQPSNDNKINAKMIENQLIQENKKFNLEYQKLITDIASAKTEEEINMIIDSLNTNLQKTGQALNTVREKISTRLDRINALSHKGELSSNISFSDSGEIQVARGKYGTELKKQFHAYRDFLEKQNKLGTHFTAGRKKSDSFSGLRDTYIEKIRKAATSYFASKNGNDIKLGGKLADDFISMMQKAFITGQKTFDLTTPGELSQIAQEGGFIWEEISNEMLINEFNQAIGKNPNIIIEGGSITGRVRVLYRIVLDNKTKKDLQKEAETIRNKVNDYFNDLVEQVTDLDKIDDYINFTFKQENQSFEQRYTIAFSDKMYKNLKNIHILTGINKLESQISGASTLLNTYDLIDSIGAQSDAFIFSALNSSTASAFYNPNNQETIRNELTKLFSSFIYETAYNPDSFVSQVLESLNFSNSKVLYVHKIGQQTIPAFLMLEQVIKSMELIQQQQRNGKLEIVKTKISFDNTPVNIFYEQIKEKYPRPHGEKYASQRNFPTEAWQYVAVQAANNTFINTHIDITPLSSILNQSWY